MNFYFTVDFYQRLIISQTYQFRNLTFFSPFLNYELTSGLCLFVVVVKFSHVFSLLKIKHTRITYIKYIYIYVIFFPHSMITANDFAYNHVMTPNDLFALGV